MNQNGDNWSGYRELTLEQAEEQKSLISILDDSSVDLKDRLGASSRLLAVPSYEVQPELLKHVKNPEMTKHIIRTLAQLNDSRSLFPLIALYNETDSPEVKKTVVQYIHGTKDPRATDFLKHFLENSALSFRDIVEDALERCAENIDFEYTYAGPVDTLFAARGQTYGRPVTRRMLLENFETIETELQRGRPQTYIVDLQGILRISLDVHEHVLAAGGKKVKAAGEIIFEREGDYFSVGEINQRSNGYFPATTSFHWVKQFFEKAGKHEVRLDKTEFDKTYPLHGYNNADFLSTI